eukprot:TRINITY_DN22561_c1_g2_i1.p1 TRINITY_DN22561_c1_g2~~TRINITY_DN22561_c1_g2_i1.p1  ORF type:complete len:101 (-),score=5.57 TRINITY_DN22561_c1_g2_i1:300-602(-)
MVDFCIGWNVDDEEYGISFTLERFVIRIQVSLFNSITKLNVEYGPSLQCMFVLTFLWKGEFISSKLLVNFIFGMTMFPSSVFLCDAFAQLYWRRNLCFVC